MRRAEVDLRRQRNKCIRVFSFRNVFCVIVWVFLKEYDIWNSYWGIVYLILCLFFEELVIRNEFHIVVGDREDISEDLKSHQSLSQHEGFEIGYRKKKKNKNMVPRVH